MCAPLLLASCGEKTITAAEADTISKQLKFEDTNVNSATVKIINQVDSDAKIFEEFKNAIFLEVGKEYEGEASQALIETKFVNNYFFENMGDQYYTYKANGNAITVNFSKHSTVKIMNVNYGVDQTAVLNFNEKGLLTYEEQTAVASSSTETVFDIKATATYTYIYNEQ